ncbi:MAG: hypothetical protein AAB866_01090, partial [Patescibacteria group bacterium]
GKKEGEKLERSFRFAIKNYYIHIHHWIWCSLLLVLFLIIDFRNQFTLGFLVGSIIQGLFYRDKFVIFYKKDNFEKIYSKFK